MRKLLSITIFVFAFQCSTKAQLTSLQMLTIFQKTDSLLQQYLKYSTLINSNGKPLNYGQREKFINLFADNAWADDELCLTWFTEEDKMNPEKIQSRRPNVLITLQQYNFPEGVTIRVKNANISFSELAQHNISIVLNKISKGKTKDGLYIEADDTIEMKLSINENFSEVKIENIKVLNQSYHFLNDKDHDFVPDDKDKCPYLKGVRDKSKNGCPTKEEKQLAHKIEEQIYVSEEIQDEKEHEFSMQIKQQQKLEKHEMKEEKHSEIISQNHKIKKAKQKTATQKAVDYNNGLPDFFVNTDATENIDFDNSCSSTINIFELNQNQIATQSNCNSVFISPTHDGLIYLNKNSKTYQWGWLDKMNNWNVTLPNEKNNSIHFDLSDTLIHQYLVKTEASVCTSKIYFNNNKHFFSTEHQAEIFINKNPVRSNCELIFTKNINGSYQLEIKSSEDDKVLLKKNVMLTSLGNYNLNVEKFKKGLYYLSIKNHKNENYTLAFLKK